MRVDKILVRPGPKMLNADTVILEMSNPEVQRDLLDAEYQLKAAEADLANLKVQVNSELMSQKAAEAAVRSDYEQTKLQHEVDYKLHEEGIGAEITEKQSKVREQQLKIRVGLEEERTRVAVDAANARVQAQQSRVDQARATYALRRSQAEALHVKVG